MHSTNNDSIMYVNISYVLYPNTLQKQFSFDAILVNVVNITAMTIRYLDFSYTLPRCTEIHKIMYTVVNFFSLGLSCSGKKEEKIWKNLFELNKQVNIRKSTLLYVK